jgi:Helix-turn-helix of insertion element transposase
MSATDHNEMQQLDPRQLRAVDLLVEGKTDTQVAAEIEVDRSTVWRWRKRDPFFRAELARRRDELWNASGERLRALRLRAFDAIDDALDRGDWRAAVALLKLTGISDLKLDSLGSTDPDTIAKNDAMDEADALVREVEVEQMRAFRRRMAGLN